jgi:hypothetical protein
VFEEKERKNSSYLLDGENDDRASLNRNKTDYAKGKEDKTSEY